jgi:Tfp pilus assembly protein PilO
MPAIFVPSASLLYLAVYAEAAVIVLLLIALVWVLFWGLLWMWDCEQAEVERSEAKRTLETLRRMSEIHAQTVTRLRGYSGRGQPR